ncbi:Ig-like domain-containing protein [Bradymonas sediminis]|uniref:Uncharacterized protein n=1 Tax=Bradymonas sediminis TaxID=1548548 RepID=A0A2Z4FNE4_9DELT|nr:Ig-like domain-containing protein [Bradymonas sediminis]AWV90541.1 hypothetical protein DN745_14880 [Bradymonas sediminis]TDP72064.1 alpha-tubulin suppressor-like RCC1 family protein [Bradymonas sediminis]
MKRDLLLYSLRLPLAIFVVCVGLLGASACAIYEDVEPLEEATTKDDDAGSEDTTAEKGDPDASDAADAALPIPVARVALEPALVDLGVGATRQLSVTLYGEGDEVLSGREVSWLSSKPEVASVDSSGLVEGLQLGEATIIAASGGHQAEAQVTVSVAVQTVVVSPEVAVIDVLDTVQLSAVLRDASGNELSGRQVDWRSEDAAIASVDAQGLVTGEGGGVVGIIAGVDGVEARAQVTVENVLTEVALSPEVSSIEVAETLQLSAIPKNIRGDVMPAGPVTWASSDPTVLSVSGDGLLTAHRGGLARISATIDAVTGSVEFSVNDPVREVEVTPSSQELEVTSTLQFSAELRDGAGNILTRSVQTTWESDSPGVATVDGGGRVVTQAAGRARISATAEGVEGAAVLTVVSRPRSLSVSPGFLKFHVGESRELLAEALDLAGRPVSGLEVAWSSPNPDAVRIGESSGMSARVDAISAGSVTLTASVDGGRVMAGVPVISLPAVASVRTVPDRVLLLVGDSAQLEALAHDQNDAVINGADVAWSSEMPSIATVDANGLVTAQALGTAQIVATVNGKKGRATVEVVQWQQLSAGNFYSCGVLSNGDAYCWGRNTTNGVLGTGNVDSGPDNQRLVGDQSAKEPVPVVGGVQFKTIAAGYFHTCGLTDVGKAYCWGAGDLGQLGQGAYSDSAAPVAVATTLRFEEIQIGEHHTCAIDTGSKLYCWGGNDVGQIGVGAGGLENYNLPQFIIDDVQAIAIGANHSCGLHSIGDVYCSGAGEFGQLGDGSNTSSVVPVRVSTPETFQKIAAGRNHTCGLNERKELYCWGHNQSSQLGDGGFVNRSTPVLADAPYRYSEFYLGGDSTCAKDGFDKVHCWGGNRFGDLGNGAANLVEPSRTLVSGDFAWLDLSLGVHHSCGQARNSTAALCWGDNRFGSVGNDGEMEVYVKPEPVSNP